MSMLSAQVDELRELATRYDELKVGATRAVRVPLSMGSTLREAADTICKLLAENAKLRELCRRFSEYTSHDRCEGCVVKRRCNDGEVDECWQMGEIRKLARELGVEL